MSTEAQPSPEAAEQLAARELEADLAASGEVYLVVDLERRRLAIRCRGLSLEQLELDDVQLLAVEPIAVVLPRRWTVERGPYPRRLTFVTPGAAATPVPEPAASDDGGFTAELDDGWQLTVRAQPSASWWSGVARGLADAWSAALGAPVRRPPSLLIALRDAARLHALLRPGDHLLLVAASPWPAEWGQLPASVPAATEASPRVGPR